MRDQVFKDIIELLDAGYEVHMSSNSFKVIEVYKSKSREKWHEIAVDESYGTFNYWSDGAIRIMADKLSKLKKELSVPTPSHESNE